MSWVGTQLAADVLYGQQQLRLECARALKNAWVLLLQPVAGGLNANNILAATLAQQQQQQQRAAAMAGSQLPRPVAPQNPLLPGGVPGAVATAAPQSDPIQTLQVGSLWAVLLNALLPNMCTAVQLRVCHF